MTTSVPEPVPLRDVGLATILKLPLVSVGILIALLLGACPLRVAPLCIPTDTIVLFIVPTMGEGVNH